MIDKISIHLSQPDIQRNKSFFFIQGIMIGGGFGSRGCTNLESGRRRGFNFCQKGFVPNMHHPVFFLAKNENDFLSFIITTGKYIDKYL